MYPTKHSRGKNTNPANATTNSWPSLKIGRLLHFGEIELSFNTCHFDLKHFDCLFILYENRFDIFAS